MTTDLIFNVGKEYFTEDLASGDSHTISVYEDATDNLSETDDNVEPSSEPTNTNYAEQSDTFSTRQNGNDFGIDNDSSISFDFSDQSSSQNVDAFLISHSFTSDTVAGDGGATEHPITNPAMTQTRDIGSIDSLDVAAGDLNLDIGN